MAGIELEYARIREVSRALTTASENTVPRLIVVQRSVDAVLTPGGGFYMRLSSPLFRDQYNKFNQSATDAINQIPSWAMQFTNIMNVVNAMDEQMARSVQA